MKLADSLGDSAWVCLPHAEEILVIVPAAFIASHDGDGIATFLAGHIAGLRLTARWDGSPTRKLPGWLRARRRRRQDAGHAWGVDGDRGSL